jgi:hypothetical protein
MRVQSPNIFWKFNTHEVHILYHVHHDWMVEFVSFWNFSACAIANLSSEKLGGGKDREK